MQKKTAVLGLLAEFEFFFFLSLAILDPIQTPCLESVADL